MWLAAKILSLLLLVLSVIYFLLNEFMFIFIQCMSNKRPPILRGKKERQTMILKKKKKIHELPKEKDITVRM